MTSGEAADRWRADLEAWALPDWLLAQAEESPYGWPQYLWKRRSEAAGEQTPTPTQDRLQGLLGTEGTLLDVGAGRGRVSLPLAAAGHPLVAVEPDDGMAEGLVEDAAALGLAPVVIRERWPAAEPLVGEVDVALSAHVVYDVQAIAPFVAALHRVADRGVVLELSESHPWSDLAILYRKVHGIDRPDGPTYRDLAAVIEETVGIEPGMETWTRPGQLWFESWDEICDFYGRRLVVPNADRHTLRPLLEDQVTESDGRLSVGTGDRPLVTIWWSTAQL